jgi:hypothetical protein
VLAKHSKNFSLQDSLAIGVDRMQRNFEPMRRQTEEWRAQQISTATAKLIIYRAFIEGELQAPKHLAGVVHDLYFSPKYDEFQPRTMWSLSNAFTSAFKELDPIPQFKAAAKLGAFLAVANSVEARRRRSQGAVHTLWRSDQLPYTFTLPSCTSGMLDGMVDRAPRKLLPADPSATPARTPSLLHLGTLRVRVCLSTNSQLVSKQLAF